MIDWELVAKALLLWHGETTLPADIFVAVEGRDVRYSGDGTTETWSVS